MGCQQAVQMDWVQVPLAWQVQPGLFQTQTWAQPLPRMTMNPEACLQSQTVLLAQVQRPLIMRTPEVRCCRMQMAAVLTLMRWMQAHCCQV